MILSLMLILIHRRRLLMMNKLYSMGMENLLNLFWKLKVSQGCIISRVTIDVLQCTEKVVSLERLIITRLSRLYNQWCHMRFVSIYLSIWGDDIFHILERIESSQPWGKHHSKHYYCRKVDARGWTQMSKNVLIISKVYR